MVKTKEVLYVGSLYGTEIDDSRIVACEIVKRGTYGGELRTDPCSWVVTKKKLPEDESLFCIPYGGQRHFYLYHFDLGQIAEEQKLWKLLEEHKKSATVTRVSEIPEYVALSNEHLKAFDHIEGCLQGDNTQWEDVGGTIEYADLDRDPKQLKAGDIVRVKGDLHELNRYTVAVVKGDRVIVRCIYGGEEESTEDLADIVMTGEDKRKLLSNYRQSHSLE